MMGEQDAPLRPVAIATLALAICAGLSLVIAVALRVMS